MQPISWQKQMWHRWKALRNVPFRRKWFIGYDLEGNSYWEFRDRGSAALSGRMRRIVEYGSPNMHYGDYKGPPQWVQWLRHARPNAPTLEELQQDLARQYKLKQLAAQADQRWKNASLQKPAPAHASIGKEDNRSAWDGSQSEAAREMTRANDAQRQAQKGQMPFDKGAASNDEPEPAKFAPKSRV